MPTEALGNDTPSADQTDLDILNGGTGAESTEDTPPEDTTPEVTPEGEEPPDPTEVEEPDDVEDPNKEPEDEEEEDPDKKKPEEEPKEEAGLVKALKAKYPDLLKDFPAVRKAIYLTKEYEALGSVEELKEVSERIKDFDDYEQQIMNGESAILFRSIAEAGENGPQVLEKFAMNLLPTIEKFSPELRGKMIFPYLRSILSNAARDGDAVKNTNLTASVAHLCKYLWNTYEIPEVKKAPRLEENPEAARVINENRMLKMNRSNEFQGEAVSTGVTELKKIVEGTLVKDKNFTPIERRELAREIVQKTREALARDVSYNRRINSLWRQAAQAGHTRDYVPRIVAAFLGGAKSAMPAIRARVLAGALKEKGIKPTAVGQGAGGTRTAAPSRNGKVVSPRAIDYNRSSDLDILNDKITLKK